MSFKVAVTGGSGFIGRAIITALLKENIEVLSLQRSKNNFSNIDIVSFELRNVENLSIHTFSNIDVVVHAAALVHQRSASEEDHTKLNFDSTKKIFEICENAGIKKFIYLSTVGVYGINSSKDRISISSPVSPNSFYARAKLMSEDYLLNLNSNVDIVVLRLPLVYGRNSPGNFGILEKFANLNIPLPFKNVKNKRSMIRVDKLATVIAELASNKRSHLGLHLLAEKKSYSTEQIITSLKEENSKPLLLFSIPIPFIKFLLVFLGKRKLFEQIFGDLEFISTIHD